MIRVLVAERRVASLGSYSLRSAIGSGAAP
jgi:hypothetical protein